MTNVIPLKNEPELKHTEYLISENGAIGVKSKPCKMPLNFSIEDCQDGTIGLQVYDESIIADREKLAEILWVMATFLDSEERYRPTEDLAALNY